MCLINVLTNRNFSGSSCREAPTFLTWPFWGIQLPQMRSNLCVLTILIKKARSSFVSVNVTCAQLPHDFSMYLRLISEMGRVEALITYIKPPNRLKRLRELILFASVAKVFVLWLSELASLDPYHRSIHDTVHVSEIYHKPQRHLMPSVAVGKRNTWQRSSSEAFCPAFRSSSSIGATDYYF